MPDTAVAEKKEEKVIPFAPTEFPNPNDPHAGEPVEGFPRGGKENETITEHIRRLSMENAALRKENAELKKGSKTTEPAKQEPPKPSLATVGQAIKPS